MNETRKKMVMSITLILVIKKIDGQKSQASQLFQGSRYTVFLYIRIISLVCKIGTFPTRCSSRQVVNAMPTFRPSGPMAQIVPYNHHHFRHNTCTTPQSGLFQIGSLSNSSSLQISHRCPRSLLIVFLARTVPLTDCEWQLVAFLENSKAVRGQCSRTCPWGQRAVRHSSHFPLCFTI